MNTRKILLTALSVAACVGLTGCGSSNKLKIVHFDQTILGDKSKDLGVSIGIKKGSDTLKNDLNTALATISDSTRVTWMTEAVTRSSATNPERKENTKITGSKGTLKIGLECAYAPFNWSEVIPTEYTYPVEGHDFYAAGYDITMAKYLAQKMDYSLEIYQFEWDSLIPALQNDSINAVIAGMTDTEDRRMSIDFTDEYYRSELVLIVKESSKYASATSLTSFSGASFVSQVSTVTDSVIDDWVKDYGVVHLSPLKDFPTCLLAVQNDKADVMTAELPVAQALVNGANL